MQLGRLLRGVIPVEPYLLEPVPGAVRVSSSHGGVYLVTEEGCTCPDHRWVGAVTGILCKHRIAVRFFLGKVSD